MEWTLSLLIVLGGLLVLMATGMPVFIAFLIVNVVGVTVLWGGNAGLAQLILTTWNALASFSFLPIPMFTLLGEVVFLSGIAFNMINTLDKWLGKIPGRLGLLTVLVSTLFSTMSGSSMATAALLGETLLPEMLKRGYHKTIAIGAVMGTGGLAMLIPPSALSVILASMAQISIGKFLIVGVVPGLLIALFYATYLVGRGVLQPSLSPAYYVAPTPMSEKLIATVKYVLPLGLIVFMVTGIIFFGIATPSEAAAMGVLAGFILAALYRRMGYKLITQAMMSTMKVSVMILIILAGAQAFGQILAYTQAPREMVLWVATLALPPISYVIVMIIILLFLGMFMNSVPMMMICVPIFMPIINSLGFDPFWFCILFLICIEMGQTTPPFGTLLFIMKAVSPKGTTMAEIVKSGIPFLLCDLSAMILIMIFPPIALWLPNQMM
jgi:tripartite ATP-independent transporter DctM subunit